MLFTAVAGVAEEKQRRRNEKVALRKAERDAAKASPDDKQS
jgi:hypothetical protein